MGVSFAPSVLGPKCSGPTSSKKNASYTIGDPQRQKIYTTNKCHDLLENTHDSRAPGPLSTSAWSGVVILTTSQHCHLFKREVMRHYTFPAREKPCKSEHGFLNHDHPKSFARKCVGAESSDHTTPCVSLLNMHQQKWQPK